MKLVYCNMVIEGTILFCIIQEGSHHINKIVIVCITFLFLFIFAFEVASKYNGGNATLR